MNPFIESTVARPLSKNHPDRSWSQGPDAEPCHQNHRSCQSDSTSLGGRPVAGALTVVGCRSVSPDAQDKSTLRRRRKSARAALVLGVCLSFSSLIGLMSKPVFLTGGVAVASLLLPGQARAVDLNSATLQELQSLSGIGPKTATMIIDERSRGGKFSSLSDLSDRVRGIGPKKAAALQAAGLKVAPGAGTADAKSKSPQNRKK